MSGPKWNKFVKNNTELVIEIMKTLVTIKNENYAYALHKCDCKIEITVKTLTGLKFKLVLSPLDKISQLKFLASQQQGSPQDIIKLIYQSKELKDNNILADYKIKSGSAVHLVLRFGCGPPPEG